MDLYEDNSRMTEQNTSGQDSQPEAPGRSAHTIISPLELADQRQFTYDSIPNGDSPRHGSTNKTGPAEGSSTSGGSLTPLHGSPFQSPVQNTMGTTPPFPRQRITPRDRLTSVNEEYMASFNAEDRGFEMVPRPENPVEAHRLANNYMVNTLFLYFGENSNFTCCQKKKKKEREKINLFDTDTRQHIVGYGQKSWIFDEL